MVRGTGIAEQAAAWRPASTGWEVRVLGEAPGPHTEGCMMGFPALATPPPRSWACCPGRGNRPTTSGRRATWTRQAAPGHPALRPAGQGRGSRLLDAALLVGVNGIHSGARGLVFRDRWRERHLKFHTTAFAFDDPGTRAEVSDRFLLIGTIDRQMDLHGLRDDRVAAFTIHRSSN